jgi:hypothetical protein
MTNNLVDECKDLYTFIYATQDVNRDMFFNNCVKQRLNELIKDNSNQLDYQLNQLEKYIDSIILELPKYERCSNYKIRNKNLTKYNISIINRIIKVYSKSCLSSSIILKHYCQGGDINA